MTGPYRSSGPTVVPYFGYRDAALRWPAEGDAAATSPTGHVVHIVVDDVDAHHERAMAGGARIVYGPEETDSGTRRYRALDPEGYEWNFGTYGPSV